MNPTSIPMQSVIRSGQSSDGDYALAIDPATAGWEFSGLRIVELEPGTAINIVLTGEEALVLPLNGGATVEVGAESFTLTGRPDVFAGPSDFVYLPLGSTATITAAASAGSQDTAPRRFAVSTAKAARTLPVQYGTAADVSVDLRGAGSCSRQVNNYTLGTQIEVDHLLVCEVFTPGGNWSSYPPHKHDEHSENERELEEIYYFEIKDSPEGGAGFAYHRVYGQVDRPVEILEEIRSGDVVLVAHGFHGPTMAAPGYDLYYLNVMAGPATDSRWLSVDDPEHHWIRETWLGQKIDPRLPIAPLPDTAGFPSHSNTELGPKDD